MSFHSINETNEISMNYDDIFIHKHYAPFYNQRIMNMYPLNQNIIQINEYFVIIKTLFWIYY